VLNYLISRAGRAARQNQHTDNQKVYSNMQNRNPKYRDIEEAEFTEIKTEVKKTENEKKSN
jgi:CRISPR/Cas system-associated endonuclease/helicase Cas3